MPGVRFVPLAGEPVFETAVLTARDDKSLATAAFLNSLTRAVAVRAADSRPAALRRVA